MTMYRTIHGSAHDIPLPSGSVQMIATSPPYWGLRKYAGDQGVDWPAVTYRFNEWCEPVTVDAMRCELGLEPSPVAYIGHLILCLREWRRVLRDDGVCFVNLGDSYANSADSGGANRNDGGPAVRITGMQNKATAGLKPKDKCGIPELFVMAARADGWWWRSTIVWAKPNPMPESVTDRPTSAWEHVFLLAKSARYYYDADAVREAHKPESIQRMQYDFSPNQDGKYPNDERQTLDPKQFCNSAGRNLRNVWHIATQPTPFAHFATWPEKLVEPMIRAGTSARGCCPDCGAPWTRVVERGDNSFPGSSHTHERDAEQGNTQTHKSGKPAGTIMAQRWYQKQPDTTTGWQPTCTCGHEHTVPCTVLDPFAGSGTTLQVAVREGRQAIGVDISAEYLDDVMGQRIGAGMQIGMSL